MKGVIVTMPDGSAWAIPLPVIIESRAEYLHEAKPDEFPTIAEARAEAAAEMDDDAAAIDWLENNMDWSDVEGRAWRVREPAAVDYADGLANGAKSIAHLPPSVVRDVEARAPMPVVPT